MAKKKFPDLSGDGKITKKDILMGRGVIKKAMGGGAMKKRVMRRGGGMMKKPMLKRGGKVKK